MQKGRDWFLNRDNICIKGDIDLDIVEILIGVLANRTLCEYDFNIEEVTPCHPSKRITDRKRYWAGLYGPDWNEAVFGVFQNNNNDKHDNDDDNDDDNNQDDDNGNDTTNGRELIEIISSEDDK